ncbi:MAG TPA: right-handed parallel beta-helix repeat-containing protein [Rhodothermales bacterium]|nr:right-handed parallel beta-helix repeat-containing protein [Rhodothermales bacterium]
MPFPAATHSEVLAIASEMRSRLDDIEARLSALETPPPPAGERTHYVETVEAWEATTLQSGHTYVLSTMTVPGTLEVNVDDVTIKAADDAKVVFHAYRVLGGEIIKHGDRYWMAYTHSLYTHPATQEGPWDGHRQRMRPEQFLVNGKLLEAVYDAGDLKPGTFYVDGPSSAPVAVWFMPHEGTPEIVAYAHHARLLFGTGKNVTIEGISFEGAASTGKRGAVLTGDGWWLHRCMVRYSAGPGFEVTGGDVIVSDCLSEKNGQLNYLVHHYDTCSITNCISRHGNRKGFNAAWEAGGCKIVNDWDSGGNNILVRDYLSEHDDGPGLGFDINNRNAVVKNVTVRDSLAAGIMFEFGFYDGEAENLRVEGVRPYQVPMQTNVRQDGIVWQAAVHDSTFIGLHAEGCAKPFVFKEHERRGASLRNEIRQITARNVERESVYVERMSEAAIAGAIISGAKPATVAEWLDAGNTIETLRMI